jgi:hypothetical protein
MHRNRPIHHVAFHICPQLQADYFMQDDALLRTTHAPCPAVRYEGVIVCDQRGSAVDER